VPEAVAPILPTGARASIQRKCAHCEEEERLATKTAPGADPAFTVGEADDPLECEADATAEAVIRRMEGASASGPSVPVPSVQRKCAACLEEERRSAAGAAAASGRTVHAKGGEGRAAPKVPGVPRSVARQLRAGGGGAERLPTPVRGRMESAFGADFSGVRVHTGHAAAAMSRALDARAFTHGRDVYFASGQYEPYSREGGLLLAHELTHVVQQTGPGQVRRAPPKPTAPPSAMPSAGPSDFEMKRQPKSDWTRIYFPKGSSKLSANDKTEIGILKLLLKAGVSVTGYASVEETATVAQDRADVVKAELEKGPNKATVTSAKGNAGATEGTSDLPQARSAEIVEATAKPTVKDCKLKDKGGKLVNPPTQACTALDPKTWTAFQNAHPIAKTAMSEAVGAVTGAPTADDAALLDRFFGAHDAATLATLRTNLGNLQKHVDRVDKVTSCGGSCDTGGCETGSVIAYNNGEVDAKSRLTLCVPSFRARNQNDQVRNLIHETAHGTSPLGGKKGEGSKDVAYRHERMLFHLSAADRLRNSDSYALFALFLHEFRSTAKKGAVPTGISTPSKDDLDKAFTGKEPDALSLALARLEKRLGWSFQWMSGLFGEMADVRKGSTTWTRSWAEDLMKKAAGLFPLTAPPGKPTVDDQARVAAMLDRYERMRLGAKRDLTVGKMAKGVIHWPSSGKKPVVGASLEVGPDFFKATADDQVSLLLQHLAYATREVEKAFVPAYVALAAWIHGKNP
jgi:hypothetical protein